MGEHGALRDTGGAAGVLQKRQILAGEHDRLQFQPEAAAKSGLERQRARDAPGGNLLAYMTQYEIDDEALGHRQHIADTGDQHLLELRAREYLLQYVREILDDVDGLRAGIL